MGTPRAGGEIIKIKNPRNPGRVRTGTVLSWTSYGSPMCVMDDTGEERAFPADWVTVLAQAEPAEDSV
jgi:type IV secretory pathway VirB4 component